MKQTAVEWLIEEIKTKADSLSTNTKEERIVKGIYVDCLIMARETKELEKKQLRKCYHFAQIEQQKEFSSIYVGMSFEKWYDKIYKNEQKINL